MVYAAYDTRAKRGVALKFAAPERSSDADAERRLIREAKVMTMLRHRHICRVFKLDEYDGQACIVMERLHGSDLTAHMSGHVLRTTEIADIACQITTALEAVHRVGLVHRDVKPGNVFVGPTGHIKLLDFGLAAPYREAKSCNLVGDYRISSTPRGTPNYMAPECIRQMPADPRSDLFSLGVVIYRLATGQLPFEGSSLSETVSNVLATDPAPLGTLCPWCPPALERITNTLLAKDPGRRYSSAAALREDLLGLCAVA